jgi:indolepyruvate ferredoxin oxidoreductase alpha subunit
MGSAFSVGHGAQTVFNTIPGNTKRVVAFFGDSTFFHTGIGALTEVVYNNSNTICCILDNHITGMTGHQNNPGNGLNARGEIATRISIEAVCRALGVKHLRKIDPNNLREVEEALEWARPLTEPCVIITEYPCVLKKITEAEKAAYNNPFKAKCAVDAAKCVGCKMCVGVGCPALSFDGEAKKAVIDPVQCVGCKVCAQVCPKEAIA